MKIDDTRLLNFIRAISRDYRLTLRRHGSDGWALYRRSSRRQ